MLRHDIATKDKIALDIINNEIVEAEYKCHHILPIVLEGDIKVENDSKWQTYCKSIAQLEKQRRQSFSIIIGQCMKVLLDKMKHDLDWYTTSESYDPLTLIKLIE